MTGSVRDDACRVAPAFLGGNCSHQSAQFAATAFKLGHLPLIFPIAHLHLAELYFDKIEQRFYRAFRYGHLRIPFTGLRRCDFRLVMLKNR